MLRFAKILIFLSITFLVVIATPIYAILKSMAPHAIIESVSKGLPDGVNLTVGSVSSKANLEITYEDVRLLAKNFSLVIPHVTVKPIANFREPVFFSLKEIIFENNRQAINAKNIDARLKVNGLTKDHLSIEGEFDEIGALEEALISGGNFVIAGVNSSSAILEMEAQSIKTTIQTPEGLLDLEINNSQNVIELGKALSVETLAEKVLVLFSRSESVNFGEKYTGETVRLNFSLRSRKDVSQWELPISLSSEDIVANKTYLFDELNLQAKGKWRTPDGSQCSLVQILSKKEECGKLTDVLDVDLTLKNNSESISFDGNGYCVAPKSGCRQIIESRIRSSKTEKIFSRLLMSEAFNPIFTSVLMGVLLSSPVSHSEFTHSVNLNVNGAQVLINDNPLF